MTTTKKNPLSPEQKAAVLKALEDPEKKRQVVAILTAAGYLKEEV